MGKKYINMPFFWAVPVVLWQILFLYVPLMCVVFMSFRSHSFEYFIPFFSWTYLSVIIRTFAVAFCTALSCLIIAYPLVYWIVFEAKKFKNLLLLLLFLPFLTTFLLHVYAWMFVLERGGALNSILEYIGLINEPLHFLSTSLAVLFVMIYCYIPFMILPLYSSLEKFDGRFFEASYDLGATWWQTFWRILVPISYPAIRSGFFLVLVPAFGEFAIPELIGGDKHMFVGTIIAHYTMSSQNVSLAAAFTLLTSLLLLVMVIILYVVFNKIMKKLIRG